MLVQAVVAIRFCPRLFKLRESLQTGSSSQPAQHNDNAFQLPYRMVLAVATLDSIIIHDTQVCHVFGGTMSVTPVTAA